MIQSFARIKSINAVIYVFQHNIIKYVEIINREDIIILDAHAHHKEAVVLYLL